MMKSHIKRNISQNARQKLRITYTCMCVCVRAKSTMQNNLHSEPFKMWHVYNRLKFWRISTDFYNLCIALIVTVTATKVKFTKSH